MWRGKRKKSPNQHRTRSLLDIFLVRATINADMTVVAQTLKLKSEDDGDGMRKKTATRSVSVASTAFAAANANGRERLKVDGLADVLSNDDASYSEGDEDDVDDDDEGYIEVQVPTLFGNNFEDGVNEADLVYPTERKQLNLFLFHQKAPQICGFFTKNLHGFEDMNRFVLPTSDQITEANDMLSEEMQKLRFKNGQQPCPVAVFRVTGTTETLCGVFPCLRGSYGAIQGLAMSCRLLLKARLLENGEGGILCKSGSIRVKAIACMTGESFSSIKARVDLCDPDRT